MRRLFNKRGVSLTMEQTVILIVFIAFAIFFLVTLVLKSTKTIVTP